MEKMKKAWDYVKEHKKEILIGAGMTVCGVALYKVCKLKPCFDAFVTGETIDKAMGPIHIGVEDFAVGSLTDVLKYGNGATELWLENVEIGDVGKLGEEIASKIPDIPENAHIWMLMSITE